MAQAIDSGMIIDSAAMAVDTVKQVAAGAMHGAGIKVPELALGVISPEIVLLVTSCILLLIAYSKKGRTLAPIISLAGIIVAFVYTFSGWNMQETGYFNMVLCDNFCLFCNIIFLLTCGSAVLLSRGYLMRHGVDRAEYYALMLISTAGMMFMVSSTNLMVIFIGLEIMSLPLYVLAGFFRHDMKSNEASAKYFFMGAFASAFFLYGIALVFGGTGTADLKQIGMVAQMVLKEGEFYLLTGAGMILIGFAFKIASFPFHMWVPDVYQGAPTPVTAFFSVGPKAAGIAALIRIFMVGFGDVFATFEPLFWTLAFLTMTAGNIMAIMQTDIKRMLAYSSIAHAGYLLVALTAGEPGISPALFYLLSYGFFNMGAFALVIIIEKKTGHNEMSSYRGLAGQHPWLSIFLALFMFSLAGFPPTAGFFGKFYVFSAAIKAGHIWLVVFAVINSLISVFYYLGPLKAVFFDKAEGAEEAHLKVSPLVALAVIITAIGTLGLGILPGYFLDLAKSSAGMMM